MHFYRDLVKQFFDRLMASLALIVASPIVLIIILCLIIFQRGQVFFVQERPGYKAKPFHLIKFKTMKDAWDDAGELLPDAERLTWIGKIIRKTSLDEIPQLFNIALGQMSFVGPRPLLMEYLNLYSEEQFRRHLVRPGISGWAQVNGRNAISWEKKFQFDVWYVENQGFWLDLKIIFKTIIKVFKAEGISGEGSVTMEKFKGNKDSSSNSA